jgi:hypothetical protein
MSYFSRVLCHNICVVIQAMYELRVAPTFRKECQEAEKQQMDQPEKDASESNDIHWIMFVALAGVLAVAEIRIYVLLRLWTGEITGMQIAYWDVPDSGLSNPLIYIMVLSVLLIAMICYRRVQWLALAFMFSIPIAFIGMISV